MVFSSNVFLVFFLPAFLICYFISPKSWRNIVLLLFSIIFYAYGAPEFVLYLLGSTIINFYLVKLMHKTGSQRLKKLYCGLAIAVSLGLLVYFKYANFFADNFNAILGAIGLHSFTFTRILLPIGISFFTFQSITYIIDTYRGNNEPMSRLTDYMLYIIMFPQLIAGPIVRYCDIEGEIRQRDYRWSECLQGFYRFIIGLSKKILIADVIGAQVDTLLGGDLSLMNSGTAWITITAYTMQLYFDFSGYSDMAIGLGKIMGFHFPENFDNPYNSASITEFWRRWHITLGSFMRNYLYIPLGGNRCSKSRMYLNLWVVFLLSGFWHGANWNFIIWGAYHGIWLVLERIGLKKFYEKIGKAPSVVITFIITMVGWAIFRIENLHDVWTFISRLFAFDFQSFTWSSGAQFYTTLIAALAFAFVGLLPFGKKLINFTFYTDYSIKQHLVAWPIAIFMLLVCLGALNSAGFSPFIYFRF
ncbi:MAG: MBOAT family protein [Bacteroidales bacterium]|nr:MBOAT family protein [Bacteroidales bacterium]